jgi:hypothetical protein
MHFKKRQLQLEMLKLIQSPGSDTYAPGEGRSCCKYGERDVYQALVLRRDKPGCVQSSDLVLGCTKPNMHGFLLVPHALWRRSHREHHEHTESGQAHDDERLEDTLNDSSLLIAYAAMHETLSAC